MLGIKGRKRLPSKITGKKTYNFLNLFRTLCLKLKFKNHELFSFRKKKDTTCVYKIVIL